MKTCKLCLKNEATKKNSHIFPKFIGRSLIKTNSGKQKGFEIDIDSKNNKPFQDTPKEDFILCESCETKIGTLERQFANELYNKISYRDNSDFFTKKIAGNDVVFYECNNVDYKNFKFTIYSILFRAAISSLNFFCDTNLSFEQIEKLRQVLNHEIKFIDIPIIAVIPKDDKKHTYSYIYSATIKSLNYLWANNIVFIISFDQTENLIEFSNEIVTSDFSLVKLLEVNDDTWLDWLQGLMNLKIALIKNEKK